MDRTWNVRKERVKGDHKIFGTAEVWSCHLLGFGRQEESRMGWGIGVSLTLDVLNLCCCMTSK